MPAYIRLLSYFSNFILLASFLGIGVGCLLAPARARLFAWFPVLMAAVIGVVYAFRLEVALPTSGSIYFTSGTADPVVAIETMRITTARLDEQTAARTAETSSATIQALSSSVMKAPSAADPLTGSVARLTRCSDNSISPTPMIAVPIPLATPDARR